MKLHSITKCKQFCTLQNVHEILKTLGCYNAIITQKNILTYNQMAYKSNTTVVSNQTNTFIISKLSHYISPAR